VLGGREWQREARAGKPRGGGCVVAAVMAAAGVRGEPLATRLSPAVWRQWLARGVARNKTSLLPWQRTFRCILIR